MMGIFAPTSRKEFFDSYVTDSAAAGFIDFLFGRPVPVPVSPDFTNAHTASLATFAALQNADEDLFQRAYSELSRRPPKAESPWLLNDPLIYGLVLGCVRFGADRSWLETVLKFRIQHSTGEPHDTASTFGDILAENWKSEANMRPLILVSKHLLGYDTSDPTLLNSVYQTVAGTTFPYFQSSFLNAIYLRSFDVVIVSKAPEDPQRQRVQSMVVGAVWKWSGAVGWAFWTTGLIGIVLSAFLFVLWIRGLPDGVVKDWVETLVSLGVPLIAMFPFWSWIDKRKRIVGRVRNWVSAGAFGFDPDVLGYTSNADEPNDPS